ncbi:MAG: SDR family NAD(P)-dependent oxidoreductase [Actinomycetota bacterium]
MSVNMNVNIGDLSGKSAVVTGANRGIGAAIALGLAKAGADIIATSRQMSAAEEIGREVTALGRKFTPIAADLSDRKQSSEFASRVLDLVPRVDILINNAGITARYPAAEIPLEEWDRVMEVNLNSQFILAQGFGRHMIDNGAGRIIFIASIMSFQGGLKIPPYAASKHAIIGLTKALSNEWSALGVNVNAIAPGYIATDHNTALRSDPVRMPEVSSRIPIGRWGVSDDVVGSAVFLSGSGAKYISGSVITVDGGWVAR